MHLIVCAHGFLSGPYSLKKLIQQLQKLQNFIILASTVNEGEAGTSDGILNAGIRLSYEITEFVSKNYCTQISFIGSSMGGLICRVAIGLLLNIDSNNILGLEPMFYISMGTPHLGILESTYFNKYMAYLLTLRNESIEDFSLNTDTLEILSEPRTVYLYGLSLFKSRWLFTNIDDDGLVNYSSAGITKVKWTLPETYTDVLGILRDYKDSEYIIQPDNKTKEDVILQNLQKLSWNRVLCTNGSFGLISHAIVSTGYSPFYNSEIIPTINDIISGII